MDRQPHTAIRQLHPEDVTLLVQHRTNVLTRAKTLERARENYNFAENPDVSVGQINRIQFRRRLNSVIETGVLGFIAKCGSH